MFSFFFTSYKYPLIFHVSVSSESKHGLQHFFIGIKLVLLDNVSGDGQVKHRISELNLVVDVSPEAQKCLHVVLFNAQDRIVEGRGTVLVYNVGIEVFAMMVFEEEYGHDTLFSLGCAVERC